MILLNKMKELKSAYKKCMKMFFFVYIKNKLKEKKSKTDRYYIKCLKTSDNIHKIYEIKYHFLVKVIQKNI